MLRFLIPAALAGMLAAGASSAATFDFQAYADGTDFTNTNDDLRTGGEADWATIVGGTGVGILDVTSGISVVGSAFGTSASGTSPLFAYFDSGNAGLGVCGNTGQCDPTNDDNIGAIGGSDNAGDGTFETLVLTFNQQVKASQILFRAEGHGLYTGNVRINGTETAVLNGVLNTSLTASIFNFDYIPVPSGTAGDATNEFYIEAMTVSAVPVPAALPLMLIGLGGLGVLRYRRKRA